MNKEIRFFKKTRRSKKAFSLVEVILAGGLAVLIASAMLPLFTQGAYYLSRARKLRAQAAEANESMKLGQTVASSVNDITYGEKEKYKITTTINLGSIGEKTGGAAQEYIFIRAGSSNDTTQTVVYYLDFDRVDEA